MHAKAMRTVKSDWFQNFILGTIIFAGILIGLETVPSILKQFGALLRLLNTAIIWIFIAEAAIKILAEGRRPWRYFMDPWNVFDFAIVVGCLLPADNHYLVVLRLVRVLRMVRLVKALPQLQILVTALMKSIPAMLYVCLFLFLLFYGYGVAGTFLFAANDPLHFGSLPRSMLALFEVVTLEGWVDIMYIQMYGCDRYWYDNMAELCTNPTAAPVTSAIFFVTFVLLGAMIVVNLFIGVITNSVEESQREQRQIENRLLRQQEEESDKIEAHLLELQEQLSKMQASIERIRDSTS